ncbi:MAG: hypothetical protein NC092_00565 [Butyrivibrio sp.]|nr:hypothetical protein [Muribaculum sp.]MCM1551165.1 hypothetical protein [Butyrivibrio sp.]
MERAKQIIKEYLIDPFKEKEYSYIGMEFEYPVICLGGAASFREIGSAFLARLMEEHGFQEELRGTDGYYVRVSKDGDSVSYDYSYGLLELSMGKQRSLHTLRARMLPLLKLAQEYYRTYDCVLTGMGTRPVRERNVEYTCDPFYTMIREYLERYTEDKRPDKCFPNMFSVQTHIDVPYADLLETYNLFNRLDFVRGLLFANSLGLSEGGRVNYCVRDWLWDSCGIPNTGIYDKSFASLEELAEEISREKIFVEKDGERLYVIKPTRLADYLADKDTPQERIRLFRSFKRVVLNSYHVLEVRGDCTQPVKDSFVTAAFHVGIAYNYRKAARVLERFLTDHKLGASNSELREMAVAGREIAAEEDMKLLLYQLLDIAREGLAARGYGEEILLTPLRERVLRFTNPAKELHKALQAGTDIRELLFRYAEM